jgi:hypothetical protein
MEPEQVTRPKNPTRYMIMKVFIMTVTLIDTMFKFIVFYFVVLYCSFISVPYNPVHVSVGLLGVEPVML